MINNTKQLISYKILYHLRLNETALSAYKLKDKLLIFDKEHAKRTKVSYYLFYYYHSSSSITEFVLHCWGLRYMMPKGTTIKQTLG